MSEGEENYTCYMCKANHEGYSGRCPNCLEWNTMVADSEKSTFKMPRAYEKFEENK